MKKRVDDLKRLWEDFEEDVRHYITDFDYEECMGFVEEGLQDLANQVRDYVCDLKWKRDWKAK